MKDEELIRFGKYVRKLAENRFNGKRSVTVAELAETLNWDRQLTYKWLAASVKDNLVVLEPGTSERNVKRYSPGRSQATRFLPEPVDVLNHCEELEEFSGFLDPLTGKWKKLRRPSKESSKATGSAA